MRNVRIAVATIAAVIVCAGPVGLAAARGGAVPQPSLRFQTAKSIRLDATSSNEVRVTVINRSGKRLQIAFSAQPAEGVTVTPKSNLTLAPYRGRQFVLDVGSLTGESYEGDLMVNAPGVIPAYKTLIMAKQPTVLGWKSFVIPMGAGAVFILIAIVMYEWKPATAKNAHAVSGTFSRLGHAKWSYAKSWGSITGLALGAVAALSSATFLPEERLIDVRSIAAMSFAFGAMIAAAPQVFTALRSLIDWRTGQGQKGLRLQWYVFAFLLASVVTLSGVIGEGYTMWQLLREMRNSRFMPPVMTVIFMVGLGVAALILLVYTRMGVSEILRNQYVAKIHHGTLKPQRQDVTPSTAIEDPPQGPVGGGEGVQPTPNGVIDVEEPWYVL